MNFISAEGLEGSGSRGTWVDIEPHRPHLAVEAVGQRILRQISANFRGPAVLHEAWKKRWYTPL